VQWLIEEIEPVLSTFDGASQFQVIAGTRDSATRGLHQERRIDVR
jgi:hypothetical protein